MARQTYGKKGGVPSRQYFSGELNMSENGQSRSAAKINEKRIFVLDTNILLHDSTCLNAFYGSVVVIPLVVLEELDHFKSEKSELGLNARHVSRKLDELRLKGSLEKGVLLQNGIESVLVKVLATFPEIFEKKTDLPLDVVCRLGWPRY